MAALRACFGAVGKARACVADTSVPSASASMRALTEAGSAAISARRSMSTAQPFASMSPDKMEKGESTL